MNTVTDSTLVNDFNPAMAPKYERARNLYIAAPRESLIQLRGLAKEIVIDVLSEHGQAASIEQDLHALLKLLDNEKYLPAEITRLLHEIRISGNKAAHPEKYNIKQEELVSSAKEGLLALCDVIDRIQCSIHGKSPLNVEFVEPVGDAMKDASYKALFKNDPAAKFDVAVSLLNENFNRHLEELNDRGMSARDPYEFDKNAVHLLESVSNFSHLDSRYVLGHTYMEGIGCKRDPKIAFEHLFYAASQNHVDAQVYFGEAAFNIEDYNTDYLIEDAIEFLELAANLGNPIAQHRLSLILAEGKHAEKDSERALSLLMSAASSGLPESQWKLAEHYKSQNDKDNYWLYIEKALENGCHNAILSKARTLSEDGSIKAALELYTEYLNNSDDSDAHFEMVCLVLKLGEFDPNKLLRGLNGLVECYQNPNASSGTRREIERLSSKYLNIMESVVSQQPKLSEQLGFIALKFRPNGHPFNSPEAQFEAMRKLSDFRQTNPDNESIAYSRKLFYSPRSNRPTTTTKLTGKAKTGRNDDCPCESGLKYKKCCGK